MLCATKLSGVNGAYDFGKNSTLTKLHIFVYKITDNFTSFFHLMNCFPINTEFLLKHCQVYFFHHKRKSKLLCRISKTHSVYGSHFLVAPVYLEEN